MITGAHIIIYSSNPEKDRAFIRDVLKFPYIDTGEGWLNIRFAASRSGYSPFKREWHSRVLLNVR